MNNFCLIFAFFAFTSSSASKQAVKSGNATTSIPISDIKSMNHSITTAITTAKTSQTKFFATTTTLAPTPAFTAKSIKLSPTKKAALKLVTETTKSSNKTTSTKDPTTTFLTTKLLKTTTSKAAAKITKVPTTFASPTTTSSSTQAITTVPLAPHALMFQNLLKVRQCSCDETEACALSASLQISDCKKQCAHKMEYFGEDIDKLISCFMKTEEELRAFDKCLSSNNNFCVSNNNTLVYIDTPNYASFVGNQSLHASDVEVDAVRAGVMVKKARKAFVHFRLFQKCVANCLKHQIVQCYETARCAVPVPSAEELGEILDGCSQMKVHDHVHSACHCLVQKQQVRKLIGVCPLVLDRHLMRRL